ncbi:hypothetical protein OZX68_07135 [Streptococcaceae bacterium ESL0729]|nr:hypothetical protein OZX68_07135 [Streptococcaceae bacterium ESL0729]
MKQKLFMALIALALLGAVPTRTQAHQVDGQDTQEVIDGKIESVISVLHQDNILGDEEESSPIAARFGYRWRCNTCGAVGAWQFSLITAEKYAIEHLRRSRTCKLVTTSAV